MILTCWSFFVKGDVALGIICHFTFEVALAVLGGGFKEWYIILTPNLGELIQFDEHIVEIDRNHQLVNSNITFLPPWMATLSPGPPCQESEVEDRAKSLMQQFLSEAPIPAVEVPEKLVTWLNQALAIMIWCHHEWWNYSSFFIININIIHHHPSSIILKTITMNHESWIISHEPSIILHLIIRHQQLFVNFVCALFWRFYSTIPHIFYRLFRKR